ncbi:MAG: B12-binding domain-containing protein [Clostridiales bacterium]|jgi:methanogenic corrinoid protein MtbC1|nr:B12-binding domain-containing protein [Eubacteriales bacterium]MDH7567272.1 B12-binding domain-containing protein [Clostridiales bacterium]
MNKKLVEAMAELDEDLVMEEVKALKTLNAPVLDIIASLQEGMGIVGKRFEEKEYSLSQLMTSAEIFYEVSHLLGETGMPIPHPNMAPSMTTSTTSAK